MWGRRLKLRKAETLTSIRLGRWVHRKACEGGESTPQSHFHFALVAALSQMPGRLYHELQEQHMWKTHSTAQRQKSQLQAASVPGGSDLGKAGAAGAVTIAGVDKEAYSGEATEEAFAPELPPSVEEAGADIGDATGNDTVLCPSIASRRRGEVADPMAVVEGAGGGGPAGARTGTIGVGGGGPFGFEYVPGGGGGPRRRRPPVAAPGDPHVPSSEEEESRGLEESLDSGSGLLERERLLVEVAVFGTGSGAKRPVRSRPGPGVEAFVFALGCRGLLGGMAQWIWPPDDKSRYPDTPGKLAAAQCTHAADMRTRWP
ncbi:hypothetical protein AK812_SmicGene14075 [Symbiodinium microadriaticum]|uniref:Uncharacterized protein n=1 Tax=Symbiodinium microadriaticum TaxID=2951 RepID=A0A1Q9E6G1_SYMMI|nr:hypothetical protein AK812_SmicGene14075 [Symbiodinium microadriaticum]